MSMFAKIGSWFAIHDEDDDELESYDADQTAPRRNVVPLTEAGRRVGPSVAVFAPRGFSDVTEIADALRARQVAIVNLQGADRTLLSAWSTSRRASRTRSTDAFKNSPKRSTS